MTIKDLKNIIKTAEESGLNDSSQVMLRSEEDSFTHEIYIGDFIIENPVENGRSPRLVLWK